eukprot:1312177-Prymnesium_polylepis.1
MKFTSPWPRTARATVRAAPLPSRLGLAVDDPHREAPLVRRGRADQVVVQQLDRWRPAAVKRRRLGGELREVGVRQAVGDVDARAEVLVDAEDRHLYPRGGLRRAVCRSLHAAVRDDRELVRDAGRLQAAVQPAQL